MTMPLVKTIKDHLRVFLEDEVLYRARPGSKAPPPPDPRLRAPDELLRELNSTGTAAFPGFLSPERVSRLVETIAAAHAGRRPELKTRSSSEGGIHYIDNPLRIPEVLQLALNPFFLGLIEAYFQADAYLADVDMRRVEPLDMEAFERLSPANKKGYSSSHWHYDIRGRQLKIMIYLTDVGPGDQNFAFCPGTHRDHPGVERSRLVYEKTRFPEDWPEKNGVSVTECYGSAGTLMLFDTNAVHRLRRTNSRMRDSVTFYYTPGQQLRPLDYDPLELARLPRVEPRWLGGRR